VLLMEEAGIDIGNHQAKIVTPERLQQADLVLTMELGHAEALQVEFPQQAHKVYLLTEMIGRRYNVEDPYGRDLPAYQRMVEEVTNLIDAGLDNILALAQENARHRL
jgi:protein-tyrosine-phosphatase